MNFFKKHKEKFTNPKKKNPFDYDEKEYKKYLSRIRRNIFYFVMGLLMIVAFIVVITI